MKKIILLLVAVATLSICSISESNAQFSAGLRVGFNASKYTGNVGANRFVPGVHIGAYFRVAIKTKYRIQADVLFSTKGAVTVGSLNGSPEKYYGVPFYIDVPVMFNYKPVAGLYVEAGVQPSFALTQLNFSANTSSQFSSPSANNLKAVMFSPITGVGYEFKKVSLGVRAAFAGTSYSTFNASTYNPKTLTLMATFGFKF
ncbi:MAG TPA: porin family protein [Cytophagaceae bacterium]|jgi:hypothetical protein|nr:porin family protein [Cytophagaceae bacterium]